MSHKSQLNLTRLVHAMRSNGPLHQVCVLSAVQGLNLKITWTELVEPVLQGPVQGSRVRLNQTLGPVQGSRVRLNQTLGPVQGSSKMPCELDRTEPRHHYQQYSESMGDFENVLEAFEEVDMYTPFVSMFLVSVSGALH
jgi:hypothetical protein